MTLGSALVAATGADASIPPSPATSALIRAAVGRYLLASGPGGGAYRVVIYPVCLSSFNATYALAWVAFPNGGQPFAVVLHFQNDWSVIKDESGQGAVTTYPIPKSVQREKFCAPPLYTSADVNAVLIRHHATIQTFSSSFASPGRLYVPGDGRPTYKPGAIAFYDSTGTEDIYPIKQWINYGGVTARAIAVDRFAAFDFAITLSGRINCEGRSSYRTLTILANNDVPSGSFDLSKFCVSATPSPKPHVPRQIQTTVELEGSLRQGGLTFNRAHHPVRFAACQGYGARYDTGTIGQGPQYRWAYVEFVCRVTIRYYENGGYNDKEQTIKATLVQDNAFPPQLDWMFCGGSRAKCP